MKPEDRTALILERKKYSRTAEKKRFCREGDKLEEILNNSRYDKAEIKIAATPPNSEKRVRYTFVYDRSNERKTRIYRNGKELKNINEIPSKELTMLTDQIQKKHYIVYDPDENSIRKEKEEKKTDIITTKKELHEDKVEDIYEAQRDDVLDNAQEENRKYAEVRRKKDEAEADRRSVSNRIPTVASVAITVEEASEIKEGEVLGSNGNVLIGKYSVNTTKENTVSEAVTQIDDAVSLYSSEKEPTAITFSNGLMISGDENGDITYSLDKNEISRDDFLEMFSDGNGLYAEAEEQLDTIFASEIIPAESMEIDKEMILEREAFGI